MGRVYIVYKPDRDVWGAETILALFYEEEGARDYMNKWPIKHHPDTEYDSRYAPSKDVYCITYERSADGSLTKVEGHDIDTKLVTLYERWTEMRNGPAPGSYAALYRKSSS